MYLTSEQLATYVDQGFLFIPNCFEDVEIETINSQMPSIFAEDSPRRVLEKDTRIVRSVYGSHTTNSVLALLASHPRIVVPAQQLVASDVYIHQFKINAKAAFGGDVWEWHQDYIFWLKEDGMPENRVVNVVVYLDEVNEFNGPMLLIPRSQQIGVVDTSPRRNLTPSDGPAWISNLTADLKYSLDREMIAALVQEHGIVAPKGPRGSVLFFNANLVHGSAPNMSPFDRTILIVTYNSVENTLMPVDNPRPEFLASHNYQPVSLVSDEALLKSREVH